MVAKTMVMKKKKAMELVKNVLEIEGFKVKFGQFEEIEDSIYEYSRSACKDITVSRYLRTRLNGLDAMVLKHDGSIANPRTFLKTIRQTYS